MRHTIAALAIAFTSLSVHASNPALTSPLNGSTLPGASVTFTWSAGTNVSQYQLWVGTNLNSNDYGLCETGTSCVISGLPTNGSKVYAILYWQVKGSSNWPSVSYTFTAASSAPPPPPPPPVVPTLTAINCGAFSGASASCSATISAAAPAGGIIVSLSTGNAAVTVPVSVTVPVGATSAPFTATEGSVTVTGKTGNVMQTFTITLGASGPSPSVLPVGLAWSIVNPSDPATSYNISRSSNGGGTYTQLNTTTWTTQSYSDATVVSKATYLYRVAGIDAKGALVATTNTVTVTIP